MVATSRLDGISFVFMIDPAVGTRLPEAAATELPTNFARARESSGREFTVRDPSHHLGACGAR